MAVKTVIGTCQNVLKRSHDYDDFSVGRRVMSAETLKRDQLWVTDDVSSFVHNKSIKFVFHLLLLNLLSTFINYSLTVQKYDEQRHGTVGGRQV